MGLISVTQINNGDTADATVVDGNFDTIVNEFNGGIDEDNISPTAAIPNSVLVDIEASKVTDHADDAATYMTASSPGTTVSQSRPTTLEGELERIRYRFQANNNHLFAQYMDASAVAQSIGWVEPPPGGLNLIPSNSGFEVKTSATATDAPDGWTKEGSPTDLSIDATAVNAFGTEKRSLNIEGTTNDGVSIVCRGLKSSTKYLIGIAYIRVSGTVKLTTTNGLGSGAYQNLNLSVAAGTTATYLTGVVSSDSSGTNITVNILCGASSTEFRVYQVFMYEMSDRSSFEIPAIPTRVADYTTADDTVTNTGAGAWSNISALSLTAYVPMVGYRLVYEVTLCFKAETIGGSRGEYEYVFRIQRNIDGGGATTVEGPYAHRQSFSSSNEFGGGLVTLRYVLDNPTPGSSYAMTTDVWTKGDGSNDADTIIFNPTLGTAGDTVATVSRARLRLERM